MKRNLLTDNRAGSGAMVRRPVDEDPMIPYTPGDGSGGGNEPPQENPLLAVWRHRWAVLSIMLCFGALAVIYLRIAPKYYTSMAQLIIEPAHPAMGPGAAPVADPTASNSFLYRQQTVMMSEPVLREAARQLIGGEPIERDIHNKVQQLATMMSVEIGKQDEILNVSYDSLNAQDAARSCKAIVDAYVEHILDNRKGSKVQQVNSLQIEKAKYDAQLAQQRADYINFRNKHPEIVMQNAKGGNIYMDRVAQLSTQLTSAQLARIDAAAVAATAEAAKDDPARLYRLAQGQKATTTVGLQAQVDALQKQLDDETLRLEVIRNRFAEGHPSVIAEQQIVAQMKSHLVSVQKQFGEQYLDAVQGQLDQATSREDEIDKQLRKARQDAIDVDGSSGELQTRDAELAATAKLVDALDTRIKALQTEIDTDAPNVNSVNSPMVADRPSKPQPARVLGLMLAIGLLMGGGFAVVRDRMDGRLRSAEEIASTLGLPVIGAIPHMKRGLTALARSQAAHWDPLSEVAEAYRAVRTAVHFGVPADGARTLVVTSPAPGDGKSTLASNLAITMAQAGKRTLLLDADFRRPVQHKMFEVKEDSGLTSVLAGSQTLDDAIHRTLVEGLDLLPAGPMPLNPSELLNGEAFLNILEELTTRYDHIVLDGPPVMAVTDSRILGALCDVTIMVLRAGKTTRKAAELARASLLSVQARIIGVAVNDVAKGEPQYGYYGDYSYQPVDSDRRRVVDEARASNGHGGNGKLRNRLPSPVER